MELREVREKWGDWKVEIVDGNRSVSRCWIVDRQMRIGRCSVKVGGIAGVGTDCEYRNRGLARQVMEGSVEWMKREGYDASFLFGIQDFYHRFGFVTCMAERRLYLDTRSAERAENKGRIRPMKKDDIPQIARIYNRNNACRTGSVVRNSRIWRGFPMGSQFGVDAAVRVVVDDRDRVRGYVVYDPVENRVRAAEVGGDGEEVFSAILHFMARRAVRLRREQVSLSIPVDHPFARFCRNFGCRDSTHFSRNAGAMGRMIDLRSCLEKVIPELASRWGRDERDVTLDIATDIGSCALCWEGDRLLVKEARGMGRRVRLGQDGLMALMMGYLAPEDLKMAGKLSASQGISPLLERLFPLQQAHMWWPDRF